MNPPPANVVVTDYLNDDFATEKKILDGVAGIEAAGARSETELVGKVEDAAALVVYHEIILTRETLSRLKNCKLIVRGGVGHDNIDGKSAREFGIDVANIPDYGTEEVADSAIGMMLSLTRGIHQYNSFHRRRDAVWNQDFARPLFRLRGRTLGVVGLGRIGTATALRAKAFGMRVLFYDPYKPAGTDKALGIERTNSLFELLEQSYVVTLHCCLTEETRRMIDKNAIDRMQDGSFLVNTARGAVLEAAAVPEAIASGKLAGAGIDVLEEEPPSDDHPVMLAWRDPNHPAHDRMIINTHSAYYSEEGEQEIRRKGAENCKRAILGEAVLNVVN